MNPIQLKLAALFLLLGEGEAKGGGGGSMITLFAPMILIFVVIYFMMIRPQKRQQKERESMITNLKKNDKVLTSGGVFGIVDKVKDNEVILKIDERSDVRMRVAKSAVVGIEKVSGAADEKKPEEQKTEKK